MLLLEALDAHIFKEEWDFFPAAFGLLDFSELEAMAQVHAEEGTALEEVGDDPRLHDRSPA